MINIKKEQIHFAFNPAEYRYDREHGEIEEVVSMAAREHGCPRGDIRLKGIEYPEDIVW